VEFIARRQNINTFKISELNVVCLLAVTNMATGRNLYICFVREKGAEDDVWVWLGGRDCVLRNLMLHVLRTEHRSGGQINEHEMHGTHGIPRAEEKYVNEFVSGSLKKEVTPKT